jgi:hypothetical protein
MSFNQTKEREGEEIYRNKVSSNHAPVPPHEKLLFYQLWFDGCSLRDLYRIFGCDPLGRAARWGLPKRNRYDNQFEKAGGPHTKWKDKENEILTDLKKANVLYPEIGIILNRTPASVYGQAKKMGLIVRREICANCGNKIDLRGPSAKYCLFCALRKHTVPYEQVRFCRFCRLLIEERVTGANVCISCAIKNPQISFVESPHSGKQIINTEDAYYQNFRGAVLSLDNTGLFDDDFHGFIADTLYGEDLSEIYKLFDAEETHIQKVDKSLAAAKEKWL